MGPSQSEKMHKLGVGYQVCLILELMAMVGAEAAELGSSQSPESLVLGRGEGTDLQGSVEAWEHP